MLKEEILYFFDIDCAACALEVEEEIKKYKYIKDARIDYVSSKLYVTYDDNDIDNILYVVQSLASKVEDCKFSYNKEETHHEHHNHTHHNHNHDRHHHSIDKDKVKKIIVFILSIITVLIAIIFDKVLSYSKLNSVISIILYIISYILIGYKVLYNCFVKLKKGKVFDENFLMTVASIAAYCNKEFIEGYLVMFLYFIGEYLEDLAIDKSTARISELTSLKVDEATLVNNERVKTSSVNVGDIILVKNGEQIPLDGIIVKGETSLDTKTITGESIPVSVSINSTVYSGSINLSNVIEVKVTKPYNESTTSKIIEMVELAQSKKSESENFISKFAKIYTPIVIGLAFVVFIVEWLFIDVFTIQDAINNSIVFLVSSCPCALVISIPLSFYGGIGKCSKYGILVKGGNYIETLAKTNVMCFDKTGTLTKGNFKVKNIEPFNISQEELLQIVQSAESKSNHPIAKALDYDIKLLSFDSIEEQKGFGLICKLNNDTYYIGSYKLLNKYNIMYNKPSEVGTIIFVARNNEFLGDIILGDEIKDDSHTLTNGLKKLNIKTCMLTGDKKEVALNVANTLNLDECYYELLPQDKLDIINSFNNNNQKHSYVSYIGDGINDTPAIAQSDCGIGVGGYGHDEIINSSDIVLFSDKVSNVLTAIKISKFTMHILKFNIIFALVIKIVALIIGTIGILGSYGMLLGVFADVGVCILVVFNSLRIVFKKDFK